MRITRLEMHNIGVFDHEEIEFREKTAPDKAEIHILTGVNGSGKSTILYALASLFDLENVKRRFRDSSGCISLKFSNCLDIEISNETSNERSGPTITVQKEDRKDTVRTSASEKIQHQSFRAYRTILSEKDMVLEDLILDFAVFAYSGERSLRSVSLDGVKELKLNPLENAINFHAPPDSNQLIQWVANIKAKAAFAYQEGKATDAERYKQSIARIEEAVGEIVGFDVRFSFRYEPIAVGINVDGRELYFDVLPDGLKSVISWIADLLMRLERIKWKEECNVLDRNFILFLDEIEVHLHPKLQRKILPVVQKLFKNAQIFIATHSPFVVASVSDAWIYKLGEQDGGMGVTEVVQSKAGISYPAVLDEIFDVDEYFDIQTEAEFKEFYSIKDELLEGKEQNLSRFMEVAKKLAEKSPEISDIIGRELRQLTRLTGNEFAL